MRYKVALVIMLLVGVGFIYALTPSLRLSATKIDKALSKNVRESTISVSYPINDKWIEFPISKESADRLKVITNATVEKATDIQEIPKLVHYSIQVQILNEDDEPLLDKVYNFRPYITAYLDEEGKMYTSLYFIDQPYFIADSDEILFDLANYKGYSKVRIKLVSKDEVIKEIVVRSYNNSQISESKLDYLWLRLSDQSRLELTEGNVYPIELLRDAEKRNILLNRWHPLEPLGIPGYQYTSKDMYVLTMGPGVAVLSLKKPIMPAGLYIDKTHVGIIPLPTQGANIVIDFNLKDFNTKEANIELFWRGRGINKRIVENFKVTQKKHTHKGFYGPGYIQLKSNQKIAARIQSVQDKEVTEITQKKLFLRSFMVNTLNPLEFDVSHPEGKPVPFRIDYRCVINDDDSVDGKQLDIKYQYLDKNNKVIRTDTIRQTFILSPYDRINMNDLYKTEANVSDPVSQFFYLNSQVKKIRILGSSEDIYVTGYNRPEELVQYSLIPEDAFVFDTAEERQIRWFMLRPLDYNNLIKNNRAYQVSVQYRMPLEIEDVLKGKFFWEEFFPKEETETRDLILPVDSQVIFREESLPTYFKKIIPNQEVEVNFQKYLGKADITPLLLWVKSDDKPVEVKGFIDGNTYFEEFLRSPRGELLLGKITPTNHKIKIVSPADIDYYINYTGYEVGGLMTRSASKLSDQELTFIYNRTTLEKETIVLRFFPFFDNTQERTIITADIKPPRTRSFGTWADWTLTSYVLYVNNTEQSEIPVLGDATEYLGNGQLIFLPIGADMPLGRYEIKLKRKSGPIGYVSAIRVIPGWANERIIFREQGNE